MDASTKARLIAALAAADMADEANLAERGTIAIEPFPEVGPICTDPLPKTRREYNERAPRRGKFKRRNRGKR